MAATETTENLWATLGMPLWRFIDRRVNSPHAAEDIVQDVMLKVLTRAAADDLPPGEKLAPWALAIARNAVVDYYRQHRRQHAQIAVDLIEPTTGEEDANLAEGLRSAAPCIRAMVQRLPRLNAQALQLADLEGMEQTALAQHLGLSVSGVKSRVQRGRQMLREMILDCCHLEMDGRGHVIDYHRTERSAQYCGRGASSACGEDSASSEARLRL